MRTPRPPTLGERLDDVMWDRGHGVNDAAATIGATPTDLEQWIEDEAAPGPGDFAGVGAYLDVDVVEVRRLVLRTQMRMVQRDLRRGVVAPKGAA